MLLTDKNYLEDRPSNYGVICKVGYDWRDDITSFDVNLSMEFTERIQQAIVDNIIGIVDFHFSSVNQFTTRHLTIFSRTSQEVGNDVDIPHSSFWGLLEKSLKKHNMTFYNHIQNPYPATIPYLNLNDDEFAIRFGYDDGCGIDKLAVSGELISSDSETIKTSIILITNEHEWVLYEY